MKVYRLCRIDEIKNIFLNKNFLNVGNIVENSKNKNTYKYDKNKKYIHFFKDEDSIMYLNTNKNRCICIYEIPDELLKMNESIGFYYDRINFRKLEHVIEYAIENNYIKFEYLLKVLLINEYIDYSDYLYENLDKFTEVIYDREQNKLLTLNRKNNVLYGKES